MHSVSGGCHCGNILVQLQLPRAPETYNPRACDCDFCRKHAAAYVSDPAGSLRIRIADERLAGTYRQGSGIAELMLCRSCGVLIGALYKDAGRVYGAVNSRAIGAPTPFGAEQPVSPRTLSGGEKVVRWQGLWFSNVSIDVVGS